MTNQQNSVKIELPEFVSDNLTIEMVHGDDFSNLEELQSELLHPLARLIVTAIRQGLEQGRLKIVDGEIVYSEVTDELQVP